MGLVTTFMVGGARAVISLAIRSGRPCSYETRCIHSYGTWLIHMGHDSFIWDISHFLGHAFGKALFIRDMTHSFIWDDSFMWDMAHSYGTWLIHTWHGSFLWDIKWDRELIRMAHGSFIRDMAHSHEISNIFLAMRSERPCTNGTCLIHSYGTRFNQMGHDPFIHMGHDPFIHMGHDSFIHMGHDSIKWDMTHI